MSYRVSKFNRGGRDYGQAWRTTQKSDKARLGHYCCICGHSGSRDNPLERHHILRRAKGGGDELIGLELRCRKHHKAEHRKIRTPGYR